MESWLLSTDSQVITPTPHFFLAISAPGSLSCSPYYLYLNSWWSQYMYIWCFHSMAAHNLNVSSPHDLAVHPTSASSLPKSNCRPCQDCYLQPSHHTIPLWSLSFIFSSHFLYPDSCFQWSLTLQVISNQLIIPSYHYFSWFNIFSFFLSSLKLRGQCL